MSIDAAESPTGFFENLMHAHARLEARLVQLEHAANGITDPAESALAVAAMTSVLDFFATFGERHHQDEEQTLFPRLRALPAFTQMLGAFEFQHQMADKEQKIFAARLAAFVPGREADLRTLAHRFAEVQRAHMMAEERALFPLAQKSLARRVLVEMSDELRAV